MDARETSPAREASPSGTKLFLGGLTRTTTSEMLAEYFASFGEVVSAEVKATWAGVPCGFGFVTMRDKAIADDIVGTKHVIDGREIEPRHSVPPHRPRRVFVGGLDGAITEDDIIEYFSQFGDVETAEIPRDHDGRGRGFCFVTFASKDSVAACKQAGRFQEIGDKKVEIKDATPKGTGPVGRMQAPPGAPGYRAFSPLDRAQYSRAAQGGRGPGWPDAAPTQLSPYSSITPQGYPAYGVLPLHYTSSGFHALPNTYAYGNFFAQGAGPSAVHLVQVPPLQGGAVQPPGRGAPQPVVLVQAPGPSGGSAPLPQFAHMSLQGAMPGNAPSGGAQEQPPRPDVAPGAGPPRFG
ncbi:unnamed protein product [Pedinophyceae sp. YPF-701]|nr:unnamed protein product [Pedinophyceae sp. YPF-701]